MLTRRDAQRAKYVVGPEQGGGFAVDGYLPVVPDVVIDLRKNRQLLAFVRYWYR